MIPELLRELHPAALLGLVGLAALTWLAGMYALVEVIVRVHAWWTK